MSQSSQLYENMWNMLVFLSLLIMYGVSGSEMDESESVSVMEGDSVTLQHTNLSEIQNDDTILWMFGPKDFPLSQIKRKSDFTSFSVTDDVEFRGRLQMDQKTGSLTIRNTRIRHSGQYKLISRHKTTTKIFNVTVIDVAGQTDGVKSVSLSVTKGESVTLHADAEMHKDALMLWRFGDKGLLLAKIDVETNKSSLTDDDEIFRDRLKLDHQTGSLTITNTRTTDSGLYQLQIRGTESSQQFLLSVNAVPGLSSGAVAGIVVGVIVLLLVAGAFALIYYIRWKSKLKKKMAVTGQENEETVMEGNSVTLETGRFEIQAETGRPVLLQTGVEIQAGDLVLWTFGTENRLIVADPETNFDKRFRDRLELNKKTGSLTIKNITSNDAGHYKLQIINSEQTTLITFNVTVTDSSANQVDEEATVAMPLLNGNDLDGGNKEQATSSV